MDNNELAKPIVEEKVYILMIQREIFANKIISLASRKATPL